MKITLSLLDVVLAVFSEEGIDSILHNYYHECSK